MHSTVLHNVHIASHSTAHFTAQHSTTHIIVLHTAQYCTNVQCTVLHIAQYCTLHSAQHSTAHMHSTVLHILAAQYCTAQYCTLHSTVLHTAQYCTLHSIANCSVQNNNNNTFRCLQSHFLSSSISLWSAPVGTFVLVTIKRLNVHKTDFKCWSFIIIVDYLTQSVCCLFISGTKDLVVPSIELGNLPENNRSWQDSNLQSSDP